MRRARHPTGLRLEFANDCTCICHGFVHHIPLYICDLHSYSHLDAVTCIPIYIAIYIVTYVTIYIATHIPIYIVTHVHCTLLTFRSCNVNPCLHCALFILYPMYIVLTLFTLCPIYIQNLQLVSLLTLHRIYVVPHLNVPYLHCILFTFRICNVYPCLHCTLFTV